MPPPALAFAETPWLPFRHGLGRLEDRRGPRPEAVFAPAFAERNALNVPGPFYGAVTDTCGSGPIVAPTNVALDPDGREFVFRQPRDLVTLAAVVDAAWHDPFQGYGCDGNAGWTAALVRAWWAERERTRMAWTLARISGVEALFERELLEWLQDYVFFLETGRPPTPLDPRPSL